MDKLATVQQLPNIGLLKLMHQLELKRLQEHTTGLFTLDVVDRAWPEGYEDVVAEAQRRKLCL